MFDPNKSRHEGDNDKSICTENNNNIVNNALSFSSGVIASTINCVKSLPTDVMHLTSQSNLNGNENGKYTHRRNNVQPNLQPLLKKPINNMSTAKPLLLPAPSTDSYPQGAKTNIVTMHSNYSTSSVTSQFNNCQQQMAMGIATIQPQHFSYSGLPNTRYPYSYSTQQLTLSNGGLGTAVQLMPVMNQNNNQINNSRMQSVPLFMTPIIGAPSGMLFQPIMQQSSNTMQTINLPNSTYSNDFNQGLAIQSQPMYTSGIRNTTVYTNDFDNVLKQDIEPSKAAVIPAQIVETSETIINSRINKIQTEIEHTAQGRSNIKHRELIRTQIYRMKQTEEETPLISKDIISSTSVDIPPIEPPPELAPLEIVSVETEESSKESEIPKEIENKINEELNTLSPNNNEAEPNPPVPILAVSPNESEKNINNRVEFKTSTPISYLKRKLPSPEILEENENPKKIMKTNFTEKIDSGPKSPGTLFEKLYKDIPERPISMFNQNNRHSNKLTAVVRPEQRKILVHYLDDLIVFESDEPFPTSNKMQVVKSALKAGNIKLNSQKSKMFTDHFLFTNTDDETSPNQSQKQRLMKNNYNGLFNTKSDSCMEPLSIDIPTTNTTSSCDSVDSSQVRPLSVCSHQSPTPVPLSMKKIGKDKPSTKKVDLKPITSPVKDKIKLTQSTQPLNESNSQHLNEKSDQYIKITNNSNKLPSPVKQVSPVKVKPQKSGLDKPMWEWSANDVAEFVKQTPGCDNYVSMFLNHEIDGEALLLLSNDNLIQGALNMKIGPALKLCARIEKRKALDPPQQ